jgi:hypothetical protein
MADYHYKTRILKGDALMNELTGLQFIIDRRNEEIFRTKLQRQEIRDRMDDIAKKLHECSASDFDTNSPVWETLRDTIARVVNQAPASSPTL